MKTLKKTLCLVLAMVMVFGLCAISASANLGYADTDDITYKEAVDVLSGIGILSGDARGFRPTDSITRAEAAKVIAYIVIGNAAQADALKASSAPFVDVPASHWASGYIAYCASSGIIMGMADGYHPNNKVTGLEFAAMLLRALGYGKQGEYVGSDWAINVSKDAIRLGVFDSNLAGATTNPATREECALYAFNVVAKESGKDGSGNPIYGLQKVTYSSLIGDYISGNAFGGSGAVDANKASTFANDFNLKADPSDPDAFGRPAGHHWTQKVGGTTKTITADYPGSDTEVKLYTTKVTGADIYNLFGSDAKKLTASETTPDDADTLHLYVDGVPTVADALPDTFIKGNATKIASTGNGVETYVYSYYKDVSGVSTLFVDICIINTYMVKVKEVTAATDKNDAKTTVETLSQGALSTAANKGFETEEFAKGDYVLITVDKVNNEIKSMEPATVVEGEITLFKNSNKNIVVDETTTYAPAENAVGPGGDGSVSASAFDTTIVDNKDHKIYIDKYGYVIGIAGVTAVTDYVYVAKLAIKDSSSYDDKLSTGSSLLADVYYADGTNKIVTVKTGTGCGAFTSMPSSGDLAGKIGLYTIEMDGSKAVLTAASTAGISDNNVNKGISSAYTSGTAKKYDNKTVFFYVKGYYEPTGDQAELSVTVYTGINNVPKSKTEGADNSTPEAKLKAAVLSGDTVKAAWVDCSNFKTEDGDTVYYYNGSFSKGTNNALYYNVYETGEKETSEIKLEYSSSTAANQTAGFCYVKGSDNKLTAVDNGTGTKKGKVTYKNSDVLDAATDSITAVLADGTTKLALADANIVDLRTDGKIDSADGLADLIKTDNVTVAISYHEDGYVVDLYIISNATRPVG